MMKQIREVVKMHKVVAFLLSGLLFVVPPERPPEVGRYIYDAELVSVYDGDTITLNVDLGFNVSLNNQKMRLYGINTPEISGTERPEGLRSKMALVRMLDGKDIVLKTIKDRKGKYGRWLAVLYVNGVNVNDSLVDSGYAERVSY